MALLTLKRYQEHALQELDKYLRAARLTGPRLAFEAQTGFGYNTEPFGEIPCVCLRIPTGGGKTLMAAEAIGRMAREWSNGLPQPLVLWLVPSDTIRSQTLSALRTPGHPFRQALAQGVGDEVRVCELDELATLSWSWPPSRAFGWRTPTSAMCIRSAKSLNRTSRACPPYACRC